MRYFKSFFCFRSREIPGIYNNKNDNNVIVSIPQAYYQKMRLKNKTLPNITNLKNQEENSYEKGY